VISAAGTEAAARSGEGGPVVVGSASRDLAASDPRGWRLGGAVTYAGLALARLGLRPRVLLGADEPALAAAELDLIRDAGAELRLVPLDRGPVFDNREVGGARAQHCLEPGDQLAVTALPGEWRRAADWLFGPVAGELPDEWGSVPAASARVALGWQGLLRDLPRGGPVVRRPPGRSPLLARADLVVVSRLDLAPATPVETLGLLLRPGATLVVTEGEAGGEVWRADGSRARLVRRYRAIPAPTLIDQTGAGDAFLAGLVAARMGHPLAPADRPDADLRLAAAVGSLTVGALGVLGVPTMAAIAERLHASVRPG
jgi:sugar/nucleoside kinase (ribokinase family)